MGIIHALQPIRYKFKPWFEEHAHIEPNSTFDGISAQELDAVLPQAVKKREITDGDGNVIPDFHGNVMKAELTPHLINAVKYLELATNKAGSKIEGAVAQVKSLTAHLDQAMETLRLKNRQVLKRMAALESKLVVASMKNSASIGQEANAIADRMLMKYTEKWAAMETSIRRAEDLARDAERDAQKRTMLEDRTEKLRRLRAV